MTVPMFPCQQEAVTRLVNGEPTYLAMDMGLGKSRTFIEAVKRRGARRVLILCPTSARLVWRREINRWDPGASVVFAEREGQLSVDVRYVIVTHGMFSQRNGNVIGAFAFCRPFNMTAIDEAHAFNAADSLRVKALKRVKEKLGYIVPLSGTPIRNHAGDIFNLLLLCYPEGLKTTSGAIMHRFAFEDVFCRVTNKIFSNHHVRVIEGSKNLGLLKTRLAPFMVRVKKEEVLKDLPPIIWDQVAVALDATLMPPPETEKFDHLIRHILAEGGPEANLDVAAEALRVMGNSTALMTMRRMLGLAKLRASVEYLIDMLDSLPPSRKILVFGIHTDVIAALKNQLGEYSPAVITGATSPKDREREVDKFLTYDGCRVFLGNIQAAGTALTLVGPTCRCSDVVFVESSWTPMDNAQAACRVHRIGQRDGVVVRMLTADNTVEELIHNILLRKSHEFSTLFDERGEVQ
jgi:SWI/SNF-related matrix-associated actin-dependent regulator of chromatin subfamily A-like protein 1